MTRRGSLGDFVDATKPQPTTPSKQATNPLTAVPGPVVATRTANDTRAAMAATRANGTRKPASRRKPRQEPEPPAPAMSEVLAASVSAARSPGAWVEYSMKLPAELNDELDARWAADRAATGNRKLAVCHYKSAALARIPANVPAAAALGLEWAIANPAARPESGSGTRIAKDVADVMWALADGLRVSKKVKVRLWEVHAAAVRALLDDLAVPVTEGETAGVPAPDTPH